MRLLPEGIDDLDPNLRWIVEESLRLIEEVVCGPQDSGAGAPGMEEAKAATIANDMRAAVWKWWRDSDSDTSLPYGGVAFPQLLPRYGT